MAYHHVCSSIDNTPGKSDHIPSIFFQKYFITLWYMNGHPAFCTPVKRNYDNVMVFFQPGHNLLRSWNIENRMCIGRSLVGKSRDSYLFPFFEKLRHCCTAGHLYTSVQKIGYGAFRSFKTSIEEMVVCYV